MIGNLEQLFLVQSDVVCREFNPPIFIDRLSFYSEDERRCFGLIECQGRYFQFFCDVTVMFMHEAEVEVSFEEDNDVLLDETNIFTKFNIKKFAKVGDLLSFQCDKFDLEIDIDADFFVPREASWHG